MNRLWVKLTLAFLATALVAVGVVAWLAERNMGSQFRQYVVRNAAAQPAVVQGLIAYYTEHGSWMEVGAVMPELDHDGQGAALGRGRGRQGAGLALADASGVVIYDATGELLGQRPPAAVLAQGRPLTLPDGQQIGTLLNLEPAAVVLDEQGQSFLERVRTSLVWAGLLAVGVALVLGLFISWGLTRPVRKLTHAARAVAAGDLGQRVVVQGRDELGELGHAFNHMAASLQASEALRRNLMADISHELRTPLAVIQGNLQAILDGVFPLEQAQIASLYDETHLLTRLVEDLRELALAEAGQLRLERAPVDLVALARSVAAHFQPTAETAGVTVSVVAGADVPVVGGDADRLGQVLRNLISNALRHTPAGGRVTVSVTQTGPGVEMQVSDTGVGIAAADLPHVFDRFYRGGKGRRDSGSGLGLAIARRWVLAHGGQITARSIEGQGATFTVTLLQE